MTGAPSRHSNPFLNIVIEEEAAGSVAPFGI